MRHIGRNDTKATNLLSAKAFGTIITCIGTLASQCAKKSKYIWEASQIPTKYFNPKPKHIQHEANEQKALFDWVAFARAQHPEIDLIYHIPNGGSRNKIEAANLKRQGVRPGVPDLCLPVARGVYHGLYIELKAGSNKPTKTQIKWIQALKTQGYAVEVCYGWEHAAKTIIDYLKTQ